jgi:DNA repair protein RadC
MCEASVQQLLFEKITPQFAPGLTRSAQLEAFFQSYELGPDLLTTRLSQLSSAERQTLLEAMELARHYAAYREQAAQARRLEEKHEFPFHLLRSLTPAIRSEAREWIGFWAQYRQGHWSEVQWVERGVRTHVNFEASELFARCLPLRPRALVLVHNHPSGQTEPSWVDLRLTRQVGELAQHLGIELKGHWIVGPHSETWLPLQK